MLMIRKAVPSDLPTIRTFIEKTELDFVQELIFILVEDEQRELIGVVGIQEIQNIGLLRSLVLVPHFPVEKIVTFLESILQIALKNNYKSLYLATNNKGSIRLFQLLGFMEIEQQELPLELKLSTAVEAFVEKSDIFFMWKTL